MTSAISQRGSVGVLKPMPLQLRFILDCCRAGKTALYSAATKRIGIVGLSELINHPTSSFSIL